MTTLAESHTTDEAAIKKASADYVEYVQLARFDERWLIVNVLWRPR